MIKVVTISHFVSNYFRRFSISIGIIGFILSGTLVLISSIDKINNMKLRTSSLIEQQTQSLLAMAIRNEIDVLNERLIALEKESENFKISFHTEEILEKWNSGVVPLKFADKNYGFVQYSPIFSKIINTNDVVFFLMSFIFPMLALFFISNSIKNKINTHVSLPLKEASVFFSLSHPDERSHKAIKSIIKSVQIDEISILFVKMDEYLQKIDDFKFELEKASVERAIARTTQGLAHDIRAPFAMLKMAFDAFESAKSPAEAQSNVREVLPEINRAMANVEGMLQDIMQIGGDSKPNQEEASVEAIVGSAMGNVFRIFPDGDFEIDYVFNHKSSLFIDTIRISRVFTNILVNAVQAMKGQGRLWIKTEEQVDFIEFRLGNAGSCIPKEHLAKLFEAFFTHGKKGGTGLGLAIAQKVVTEHGGQITCESDVTALRPDGYVEFIFTLPNGSKAPPEASEPLFRGSREFREHSIKLRKALRASVTDSDNKIESELERKLRDKLGAYKGSLPHILVVDDEAPYRNMLQSLLQRDDSLISKIPLLFAKNSSEAKSNAFEKKPFLIIEDIDLGPDSDNGIEVIQALRAKGYPGRICVHSNRFLFDDQKIALAAGADSVLPKPMNRGHLLQVILSSLPEQTVMKESFDVQDKLLKVVYLDDGRSFTMIWKMKLKDELHLETYLNTSSFLAKCDADASYLQSFDAIVTDYHFAEGDEHTGKSLAKELRGRGYLGPIMLATNGDFEDDELKPHLTGAIGKEVPSISTIRSWVKV
jgi:signal transduction histidine kinase/CheY-like chemotaxis protein